MTGAQTTRLLAISLLALAFGSGAAAQQQPAGFEFTFSAPGARAMGFGGAFAPLADDATAAFSNPAGLVQLVRPELSAEGRIDITENDEEGNEVPELKGLGFVSFVMPSRRWSFALYGHRVGSIEITPTDGGTQSWASGSGFDALGLEINRLGVAAGYQLDETFALGIGASYFAADVDARRGTGQLTERSSVGLNAGVLWRPAERLSMGGYFRQGPEFEMILGSAGAAGPVRTLAFPDSYGAGIALRAAGEALTLAFEWSRVEYDSLNRLLTVDERATAMTLETADELHLGGEYAFLSKSPIIAVRLGAWLDPGHRLILSGTGGGNEREVDDDLVHAATGLGLAWQRFQLDFGMDVSDRAASFSVSGIVSF